MRRGEGCCGFGWVGVYVCACIYTRMCSRTCVCARRCLRAQGCTHMYTRVILCARVYARAHIVARVCARVFARSYMYIDAFSRMCLLFFCVFMFVVYFLLFCLHACVCCSRIVCVLYDVICICLLFIYV